jgi:hypothetical protein
VNIKFIERILVDFFLVSRQALFKVSTISSANYEVLLGELAISACTTSGFEPQNVASIFRDI